MFRLALALGCTVEELGERMSSSEFREWTVFYANDPWGEARADLRSAHLASLFYNAHRSKDAPVGQLADFVLFRPFEPEAKRETETEEEAGIRLMNQLRAVAAQQKARGIGRYHQQQQRKRRP
jgi:Protein of unknown function (DUF4035)